MHAITETVNKPVIHVVWDKAIRELVKKRGMSNCIEGLTDIQGDDQYKWVRRQKVSDGMKEIYKS